jgi:hypothetical protein
LGSRQSAEIDPVKATASLLVLALGLLTGFAHGANVPEQDVLAPETHRVIKARPTLRTVPDDPSASPHPYTVLAIPDGNNPAIEIVFDPKYTVWGNLVNDKDVFTLTLWQNKGAPEGSDRHAFTMSEIETINMRGKTIYDARVCPLHGVVMKRAPIYILYGLPADSFVEALKDFSGGPGFCLGGCVMSDDSPKETYGYICPICAAKFKAWDEAETPRRQKKP